MGNKCSKAWNINLPLNLAHLAGNKNLLRLWAPRYSLSYKYFQKVVIQIHIADCYFEFELLNVGICISI